MQEQCIARPGPATRSCSDSGFSNDSADLQLTSTGILTKNTMSKPPKVSITINRDRKRIVNGNELVVPQCKPVMNFEEISSAEDGEIEEYEDLMSDSMDYTLNIKDHLDIEMESIDSDDDCSTSISSQTQLDSICDNDNLRNNNLDNNIGIGLDIVNKCIDKRTKYAFWERDDITIPVITTKCPCFIAATVENSDVCMSLLGEETGVDLPVLQPNNFKVPFRLDHSGLSKSIEDDVLSLHPSDIYFYQFDTSRKSTNIGDSTFLKPVLSTHPTKIKDKKQMVAKTIQGNSTDNVKSKSQDIPNTANKIPLQVIQPKSEQMLIQPQMIRSVPNKSLSPISQTKLDENMTVPMPTPIQSCGETLPSAPVKKSQTVTTKSQRNTSLPSVLPNQLDQSVDITVSVQDAEIPKCNKITPLMPTKPTVTNSAHNQQHLKSNPIQLANHICYNYNHCHRKQCHFKHNISTSMFTSMCASECEAFWHFFKRLRAKNTDLLQAVIECMSPALVGAASKDLLFELIGDSLRLPILDRTALVKLIIDSLKQIVEDGEPLKYEDIIIDILVSNGCFEPTENRLHVLLLDIILSIFAEEQQFLRYWPVLSRIFDVVEHEPDRVVIDKIVKECWKDYVSVDTVKMVLLKLSLLSNMPNDIREAVENLGKFVKKIERTTSVSRTSTASSSSSLPQGTSRPPLFGEILRQLLVECAEAEELSKLFYEYRKPEYWEHSVNEIVKILTPLEGKQVECYIKFLMVTITHCLMMIDIDEDLHTFLMTLVLNVVAFLKRHATNDPHNMYWKMGAQLLGIFEDTIETFHDAPVYVAISEYQNAKDLFIFSRLIHAKRFQLALRWLRTPQFVLPLVGNELYVNFCRHIRQLFDGLYHMECKDECKDLLVWLVLERNFDTTVLQHSKGWNLYDYFLNWVGYNIKVWQKKERDIVADANHSIFHFYKHMPVPLLRNVLILLFEVVDQVGIAQLVEMVDFCNTFYQQRVDHLYFHKNLTLVEIRLLTHAFFYKMLQANSSSRDVFVKYDELPNVDSHSSSVITSVSWDLTAPIKNRVAYVMRKLDLHPIPEFSDVIYAHDVKIILEKIRRLRSDQI